MSWHQTHVKQINTFLHTLTSAAISLRAQHAPHHSISLGAGCYCRRTTWNQQHLFDPLVLTHHRGSFCASSSHHQSCTPTKGAATPHPALSFCRAPCHTLGELAAAGDLRSIWAVITTLCGANCRWYQSGHFPHPFLLLCRNILIK